MAKKKGLVHEFTKGIVKENPVLRLVLGTCPTLAVSTSVESALGMGVAASIVLICSNIAISALKKVIPSKVRITSAMQPKPILPMPPARTTVPITTSH